MTLLPRTAAEELADPRLRPALHALQELERQTEGEEDGTLADAIAACCGEGVKADGSQAAEGSDNEPVEAGEEHLRPELLPAEGSALSECPPGDANDQAVP